jgi:hypothetical protein
MKTYKNLYPHIHTFTNRYWAFRAVRCGKRDRLTFLCPFRVKCRQIKMRAKPKQTGNYDSNRITSRIYGRI